MTPELLVEYIWKIGSALLMFGVLTWIVISMFFRE